MLRERAWSSSVRKAAKTLLGLGANRQKSRGPRRHGRSLSEPRDSQVEEPPLTPSPRSRVSPRIAEQDIYQMAEQDIYLLWSPTSQPSALDNSLHLMYHLHKAAAPWQQRHPLQLYCLNSHLRGNGGGESWQQQRQGLQLSQLVPLATMVIPELATLTQPPTHCARSHHFHHLPIALRAPVRSPHPRTTSWCTCESGRQEWSTRSAEWDSSPEPRPSRTTQNNNNSSGWQTEEPKGDSPAQCPAKLKALVTTLWVWELLEIEPQKVTKAHCQQAPTSGMLCQLFCKRWKIRCYFQARSHPIIIADDLHQSSLP